MIQRGRANYDGQRQKTAKKITGREEVGQKINLQLSRTVLALWFAHRAQTLRQKALLLKPIIDRDSVNFF